MVTIYPSTLADAPSGGRPRRGLAAAALIVLASSLIACGARAQRREAGSVPAPYLTTRDQAGHEIVKTEQFVVPVGTAVRLDGLEFAATPCTLTPRQELILRQVFNSLEEITENTVGDTDQARVAEFRAMEFEVRGYSTMTGQPAQDAIAAERCATVALTHLTNLGTPAWRLKAKGIGTQGRGRRMHIEFVRTK